MVPSTESLLGEIQARYGGDNYTGGINGKPPPLKLVAKEIKASVLSRFEDQSPLSIQQMEAEAHIWGARWIQEFEQVMSVTPSAKWMIRK